MLEPGEGESLFILEVSMTKLRRIRQSRGLSLTKMAAMADISVATLIRFEKTGQVSRKTKGRVAMALKVPISEIEAVDDTPMVTS